MFLLFFLKAIALLVVIAIFLCFCALICAVLFVVCPELPPEQRDQLIASALVEASNKTLTS